jgi:hypothetical protein
MNTGSSSVLSSVISSFRCVGFYALVSGALTLPLAATGCAAADGVDDADFADDDVATDTEGAISTRAANNGYFIVTRRDNRKCLSPICGGFFVKRVNEATTVCADGSKQAECYVASIQLGGMGLTPREEEAFRTSLESGQALVKARTYKTRFNHLTLGVLKANEGWVGATGAAVDGTFFRAADNGIRCIKAPCPSIGAFGLNGADSHNVINVLFPDGADAEKVQLAQAALGTKEGILVGGGVALPKCLPNSNCGPLLIATEFYLRARRTEGKACGGHVPFGTASCNSEQVCLWSAGDLCGAADAQGKCRYKPEACTREFAPVCGCDGQTYSNVCSANAAGVSVFERGACASQ